MQYNTIVIGSGISGLSAAAILARSGESVLVVERQNRAGGTIRSFERKGITFDVGCHCTGCLGEGELLERLWNFCGVKDSISVHSHADGYNSLDFADNSSVRAYFDYRLLGEELQRHFVLDKVGIKSYLTAVQDICNRVPFYNMELPLKPFLHNYRPDQRLLTDFFAEHIQAPILGQVLSSPGFLYGVPTDKAAFEAHALMSHGYYNGAWTIADGGQSVVDAFLYALELAGAVVRTGSSVATILAEDDRVVGVQLDSGEQIGCKNVIYTGHPTLLVDMVPRGFFRPAYQTRLQALQNSMPIFAVFCRSSQPLNHVTTALNHFRMTLAVTALPGEKDVRPRDRAMLLSTAARPVACKNEGEELQEKQNGFILLGSCLWSEAVPFIGDPRSEGYQSWKKQMCYSILTQAKERWRDIFAEMGEVEVVESSSPLTFCDELLAPCGAPYGMIHCIGQPRLDTRTRLAGLYLAGQSTLMAGMVGASASAIAVAGEILGVEELWQKIRTA